MCNFLHMTDRPTTQTDGHEGSSTSNTLFAFQVPVLSGLEEYIRNIKKVQYSYSKHNIRLISKMVDPKID